MQSVSLMDQRPHKLNFVLFKLIRIIFSIFNIISYNLGINYLFKKLDLNLNLIVNSTIKFTIILKTVNIQAKCNQNYMN